MISFILVIAIHVSNYFCGRRRDYTGRVSFFTCNRYRGQGERPVLFLGYRGPCSWAGRNLSRNHAKRLVRFLTALVVWSAVYYVWNTFYMGTSYDLREILYVPTEAHLWYLYAMIPIYLVMPFFQILCRNMSLKLERAFLVITTAAVLLNFILWLFDASPTTTFRLSETVSTRTMCLSASISINTGDISG